MRNEIEQILENVINSDSHDPFQALGLHIISEKPAKSIIRTFQPHAESVRLLLDGEMLDMYKMREDGLFELIVPRLPPFEYSFEVTPPQAHSVNRHQWVLLVAKMPVAVTLDFKQFNIFLATRFANIFLHLKSEELILFRMDTSSTTIILLFLFIYIVV